MADTATDTGTYETKADKGVDGKAQVKLWRAAIALSGQTEKKWRESATKAEKLYQAGEEDKDPKRAQFNILYTNVETLVPALYNSRPEPDARRRFSDDDPVGKLVAQITERCISVTIDQQDFDGIMLAAITDAEVPGRGTTRIRYVPVMDEGKPAGEGQDAQQPQVADQRVEFEHVPWQNMRLGPAKRWEQLPWVAFEHFMTREQLVALNPEVGQTIKLESLLDGVDAQQKENKDGQNPPEIFKRAHVWEVWDREERKILFIADSYAEGPVFADDDPLQLQGFFPIPRPLYGFVKSSTLNPTVPYSLYESQANELEDITRRLKKLVKVIRWRGIRAAELDSAFESMAKLDDGELAPSSDAAVWADKGIDKGIWLMPIEQAVLVVKELYEARERIKTTIYEITGVADIMRGATDPNETLGAQKIKAQWGSLRLNRRQQEVARYARDLFRMTAEIIASKFSPQQIGMMTGIKLPTQAEKQQAMQMAQANPEMAQQAPPEMIEYLQQPSVEEVAQVLQRDLLREYKVDIESDSTIRADMERVQTTLASFMQGFSMLLTAAPAAIEAGFPPDVLADITSAFSRYFKLGKKAEDALDKLGERAKEAAAQPKTDPKAEAEKEKIAAQKESDQQKLGFEREKHTQTLAFEREKHEQTIALEREKHGQDMQLRQQEMAANQQMQTQKMEGDHKLQSQKMQDDHAIAQRKQEDDVAVKREGIQTQADTKMAVADQATRADGAANGLGKGLEAVGVGLQAIAEATGEQGEKIGALADAVLADTELVRGDDGRAAGTRRVPRARQ